MSNLLDLLNKFIGAIIAYGPKNKTKKATPQTSWIHIGGQQPTWTRFSMARNRAISRLMKPQSSRLYSI
jgi:hypothetical protein